MQGAKRAPSVRRVCQIRHPFLPFRRRPLTTPRYLGAPTTLSDVLADRVYKRSASQGAIDGGVAEPRPKRAATSPTTPADAPAPTRASPFAKNVARAGISRTSEFERILRLPRRTWLNAPDLAQLTIDATNACKTPGGTMTLWPTQAAALRDGYDLKGLFAAVAVGAGKALVSLLLPVVLGAKRPILMVPAALRDQTNLKVIPEMRRHWKLHRSLMVLGYEEMSLAKNSELLETLQPDLIIADEAHALRHTSAGRTRRVVRYMRANPGTMFVALSGTMTKRSLRDYAHLLQWTLKPDFMPLPSNWRELQDWADVLDENPPENRVVAPGALIHLCSPEDKDDVRKGYQRRLVETPGVIATGENEIGTSLEIFERKVDHVPAEVLEKLREMRRTWETPDGDEIVDSLTMWRHARELAVGMYLKWAPAPPPIWLASRRAWNRYVRETLQANRRGLDTPLQVWREMSAKVALLDKSVQAPEIELEPEDRNPAGTLRLLLDTISDEEKFLLWRKVHKTFKPTTVPVWVSPFLVLDAAKWMADKDNKAGIVWVEHDAIGKAIAQQSGRPYYGGGEAASREILDEGSRGPIIASIRAHGVGKNLQAFSKNLITSLPPAGAIVEQLVGRSHRPGQKADTVTVEVYLFCEEQKASWRKAVNDAHYITATMGAKQKILYADVGFSV